MQNSNKQLSRQFCKSPLRLQFRKKLLSILFGLQLNYGASNEWNICVLHGIEVWVYILCYEIIFY